MMLLLTPISVNPLFVQDGVKKITTSVQTFDIVLKKIHRPSVNRFDGDISWYGFTIRTKVVIQQKYEGITESIIELTRNDLHKDDTKN